MYVQDSWAHNEIPVLSYYVMLQSGQSLGDEAATDLGHMRDPQLMETYWQNVTLLFQRVAGKKTVVVHVEPDLWGYLEQANASALASQFAQKWIALRDQYAPNVLLAYHMSGWGTKHDIVSEDPPDATVKQYAQQSAAFYNAMHARFDRHLLYGATFVRATKVRMVAWQIPLGNTFLNDTWGHYRDNRVQWLLGAGNRAHLRAYVNAGYIGFMFGGGADGTTSASTDGGYFFKRVRAYAPSPLRLP